jgi:hypothetical protein
VLRLLVLAAARSDTEEFELPEFVAESAGERAMFRSRRRFWVRARGQLPDDPPLHEVRFLHRDVLASVAQEAIIRTAPRL